jgi:hypothetical protein
MFLLPNKFTLLFPPQIFPPRKIYSYPPPARTDLEKVQKKYKSLQRDFEERKIIEASIYLADTNYNDTQEMPVATKILIEKLFAVSAFDPVNEPFLGSVLVSIRKTFLRSAQDTDSLCFWFSYSVSLFKQLKEEVGEQMMSFDDRVILTCSVSESVGKMMVDLLEMIFD